MSFLLDQLLAEIVAYSNVIIVSSILGSNLTVLVRSLCVPCAFP